MIIIFMIVNVIKVSITILIPIDTLAIRFIMFHYDFIVLSLRIAGPKKLTTGFR